MTIHIQNNAWDRFIDGVLRRLGKERRVIYPDVELIYGDYGPYVYMKARKECWLKALFRRADKA